MLTSAESPDAHTVALIEAAFLQIRELARRGAGDPDRAMDACKAIDAIADAVHNLPRAITEPNNPIPTELTAGYFREWLDQHQNDSDWFSAHVGYWLASLP